MSRLITRLFEKLFTLDFWTLELWLLDSERVFGQRVARITPREAWVFYADPFILSVTDLKVEIIAERYDYFSACGDLVVLDFNIQEHELTERKVIPSDFHQSFPCPIENSGLGVVYECSEVHGLHAAFINGQPFEIPLAFQKLFAELRVVDPSWWETDDNLIVIFTHADSALGACIVGVDKTSGDITIPMSQIPSDGSREVTGRNGGKVLRFGQIYLRPVQFSIDRYGDRLDLNEIQFDPVAKEVVERSYYTLVPHLFDPKCKGVHHCDLKSRYLIVDLNLPRYCAIAFWLKAYQRVTSYFRRKMS